MKFFGKIIDGRPSIVVAQGESKGDFIYLDRFIKMKEGLKCKIK